MPESSVSSRRRFCTAIVCAYNEEKTLTGVFNALLESPLVDEIVAVDDGSTDETPAILRRFADREPTGPLRAPYGVLRGKVHPIHLPENRGKGYAMAEGILKARGEILLLVDADLLNLSPAHIAQTLRPLLEGEADMVIGCPSRKQGIKEVVDPLRPLSGERALFREDILPLVLSIQGSRYGVETLINLHYRKEGKRVRYVRLAELIHPIKLEKVDPREALGMYICEASQIAQAVARHYPLAMAAFGLDSERAWRWWNQAGDQLSAKCLTLWTQQAFHSVKRTVLQWHEPLWRGTPLLRQREERRGTPQSTQRKG
jgi:glycosyltransferase involved in cell wall biosynthesis